MGRTKLHEVSKSKVVQTCDVCRKEIPAGSPYYWFKFRYSGRHFRCMDHKPRPHELESNEKLRLHIQADEAFDLVGETGNPEDAVDAFRELLGYTEALMELLRETVDNLQGTNLEYTERYQNHEAAQMDFEDFNSQVESAISELETYIETGAEEDPDADDWTAVLEGLPPLPDLDI